MLHKLLSESILMEEKKKERQFSLWSFSTTPTIKIAFNRLCNYLPSSDQKEVCPMSSTG